MEPDICPVATGPIPTTTQVSGVTIDNPQPYCTTKQHFSRRWPDDRLPELTKSRSHDAKPNSGCVCLTFIAYFEINTHSLVTTHF